MAEIENRKGTILTQEERDRFVWLVDLVNDLSVTQLDHHEVDDLNALWRKLWDEQ